jgi:hypothetical protein
MIGSYVTSFKREIEQPGTHGICAQVLALNRRSTRHVEQIELSGLFPIMRSGTRILLQVQDLPSAHIFRTDH